MYFLWHLIRWQYELHYLWAIHVHRQWTLAPWPKSTPSASQNMDQICPAGTQLVSADKIESYKPPKMRCVLLLFNRFFVFASHLHRPPTSAKDKHYPHANCLLWTLHSVGFLNVWTRARATHLSGNTFIKMYFSIFLRHSYSRVKCIPPLIPVSSCSMRHVYPRSTSVVRQDGDRGAVM